MSKAKKYHSGGHTVTVAIIVVALLLLISIGLLLLLPKGNNSSSSTGNVISGEVITLENADSEEELRFNVQNMFPGDSVSKTHCVKITDAKVKAVSFFAGFAASNTGSDALKIRVTVDGSDTALYDGAVTDMPESLRAEVKDGVLEMQFHISVYLDTSVGNDYQGNKMALTFHWWVDDGDYATSADDSVPPAEKCCPWCFDICPWCWIIPLILMIAFVIMIGIGIAWWVFRTHKMRAARALGKSIAADDVSLAALFGAMGVGASILINKALDRDDRKDKKRK